MRETAPTIFMMGAVTYVILLTVHLRDGSFYQGQTVTRHEMGMSAFVLLHYGLVVPVTMASESPAAA